MSSGGDFEVKYTSTVFYIRFSDGSKAFLRYRIENGRMLLIETYTPPQHRGKGAARALVRKAVEVARERGLSLVPVCSYSVYYFIKNPKDRDVLADEYRRMSEGELRAYYEERLRAEREKEG